MHDLVCMISWGENIHRFPIAQGSSNSQELRVTAVESSVLQHIKTIVITNVPEWSGKMHPWFRELAVL